MDRSKVDKAEFITRQFHRTHNKRFENYALTRIWHGINSTEVKMVTQQYVIRDEGCSLLDAYFPQFNIGIEVDEAQHKAEENAAADRLRERDVIRAIGCRIYRIDVTRDIHLIHEQCDAIIRIIRDGINKPGYETCNMDDEYTPHRYIEKGYISLEDNAAFRKQIDALQCFGIYYKSSWTGGENHPLLDDVLIWFPKMHARREWINVLDETESTIYETNEDFTKNEEMIPIWLSGKRQKRYTFVYSKDSLGMVLYRFKGVFELDQEATKLEKRAVWRRTEESVKTINTILKGNRQLL